MLPKSLNSKQLEGIALNAVAKFLDRHLIVPRIYFAPPWPQKRSHVDLIAVDKNGSGSVYCVEIKQHGRDIKSATEVLKNAPSHFKVAAIFDSAPVPSRQVQDLYASSGIGKIGILRVHLSESEPTCQWELKPERFQVEPGYLLKLGSVLSSVAPDIPEQIHA